MITFLSLTCLLTSSLFETASAGQCGKSELQSLGKCLPLENFSSTSQRVVAAAYGLRLPQAVSAYLIFEPGSTNKKTHLYEIHSALIQNDKYKKSIFNESVVFYQMKEYVSSDTFQVGDTLCVVKCGTSDNFYLVYICSNTAPNTSSDPALFVIMNDRGAEISDADYTSCLSKATVAHPGATIERFP